MKAIGIDIGTTTISAVVLEVTEERVVEAKTIQNGSFLRTGRDWERIQDVSVIIEKAMDVLDELLQQYPDVGAIGLTGQMHGILYVDADGKCISPLYTWQDQRGNLPEEDGMTLVDCIQAECGLHVSSGYGLVTHIYQLRKGLVPAYAAGICTIPDYLGMVLTGRQKPLMHISMAASLGFYDSREGKFREACLRQMGIDPGILPDITDVCAALGNYHGVPVTVALGDNQASFLGTVGMKENTPLLNVGTGGQISVLSDQFFETKEIEARPFLNGKYLLVGSSLCGGRAYAILEQFFRSYAVAAGAENQPQYGIMERLAENTVRPEDDMKVVTAFNGTRSNPNLRGSISDLSEDNFTPGGLILGVLTGMARELYDMFVSIQNGTGIEATELAASGNGVRKNAVLQRIFEEMFGVRLKLARCEEEAACGAAASSMLR
ncbi:MAG: FGGY family carbohydrate kinase [Lachnospiraceae bacterium]|nr:FGGY family carbohydrate kinase [Lachnospiraceae bacterium]